jgi:hypothetical protein
MTSTEVIAYSVLGLALQFAIIYWAIRLALQHDHALQARDAVTKASAESIPASDAYQKSLTVEDVEQMRQETRASRERAEARRIAQQEAREDKPDAPLT